MADDLAGFLPGAGLDFSSSDDNNDDAATSTSEPTESREEQRERVKAEKRAIRQQKRAAKRDTQREAAAIAAQNAVATPALPANMEEEAAALETSHVQAVYNEIAPHFSATRYKPWPLVEEFLLNLPTTSWLVDVGCGNGKYLGVNGSLFCVGTDFSEGLIDTAAAKNPTTELLVADNMGLPFRDGMFDAAISIAVIHHFTTEERRQVALREIVRLVRPGGSVLVTAWAFEQEKKKYEQQDVFVPWKLQPRYQSESEKADTSLPRDELGAIVYHRFYHLFVEGEMEALAAAAVPECEVVATACDHENWYIQLTVP